MTGSPCDETVGILQRAQPMLGLLGIPQRARQGNAGPARNTTARSAHAEPARIHFHSPRLSRVQTLARLAHKFLNSHANGCAGVPVRPSSQNRMQEKLSEHNPRNLRPGSVHSGVQNPEPFKPMQGL